MKGVIYNQIKPYSGLENERRYWGRPGGGGGGVNGGGVNGGEWQYGGRGWGEWRGVNGGAVWGGGDCVCSRHY